MNVSLTSELEKLIQEKVDSKMYQTASEVVREALRLLKQRDDAEAVKLAVLRKEVQKAVDEADRGEGRAFTRSVVDEIVARGKRRLESRKARK